MFEFSPLYTRLTQAGFEAWVQPLSQSIAHKLDPNNHGDLNRWYDSINRLPSLHASETELNRNTVRIGLKDDLSYAEQETLTTILEQFKPWRKGPFDLFGIDINTEWRSDWKWNRLENAITPLAGRTVLDVGCGNGYHVLRMAGAGADLVVGIDPTLVFNMQFQVLQRYLKEQRCWVVPVTLEQLPSAINAFDTVFSMGVLYHRRSPIDHLYDLKKLIRPGGELVLETLVIDGDENDILIPPGRYAKMRNVWFIPSAKALEVLLKRCGYRDIKIIDISTTSVDEQRATNWMTFESLADFLDPLDSTKTIEGLPAPKRATFTAQV